MNKINVKLLVWEPSNSQIMKGVENYHSLTCGLFLSPTHKSNLHIYLHLKYLIQPLYTLRHVWCCRNTKNFRCGLNKRRIGD